MILVADSGSTKTDWAFVPTYAGRPEMSCRVFSTQGINPFHQSWDVISSVLMEELIPQLPGGKEMVTSVKFYGSGVRPELEQSMVRQIRKVFPFAEAVEAHSDLLGAARGLCGRNEGLACILGTGANSCLYDGKRIVKNTAALGYILGDEGSGAVLGKRFLHALYMDSSKKMDWHKFRKTYMMNYSVDLLYVKEGDISFLRWFKDLLKTRCFINICFSDLGPVLAYYKHKILKK